VEDARQAAAVVGATRYAPLGSRGMYGSGLHTGYRTRPPAEHMATANARVHVTAMLESKHAFDHLDEIAAVPGIDALTIGPTDLSQDLGVLGTPSQSAVLREHRIRLGEAARKHGKTVAMAEDTIEAVREVIALGATIVNYSSDTNVLRTTYAAAVAEIRTPKEKKA
jgi:2-keto-3-deoxy-L-rhamnonate aldolase RhmA